MPDIKAGDGLELASLMNIFASKNPPDNTIKRIYDLENLFKDLNGRVKGLDGLTDRLASLEGRVAKLETRADSSEKRLDVDEADIEELKRKVAALENMEIPDSGPAPANLDTAGIMKQIQLVKNEFNTYKIEVQKKAPVVDLEKLRLDMREYTDTQCDRVEKTLNTKVQDLADAFNHKHEMLSAEFENFKQRDFRELEGRVTALEKKLAKLAEAFANFKIPEMGAPADDSALRALAEKVAELEDALN